MLGNTVIGTDRHPRASGDPRLPMAPGIGSSTRMGCRTPPGATGGLGSMQPSETPKADFPAGVVPIPRPSAAWRVVAVEPLPEMRLRVKFVDGTSGEVHLQR